MPDISKCTNESCKHKEKCYRYVVKSKEFHQSYHPYEPDSETGECEDFMSIRNGVDENE